ncbi:Trk-type K+ transport system, membrane component [Marinactinospora thermotolerans DSM 45154]|uniref:Trk-type K+ transport system, membrane component n=2 Tax=Marinactinospora thermotolerans TaxID=531310 RepID=A0A1T4RQM8_9ACTN|nr:potassium transporter TrkG [Marinactinospora thermotolerans]SKA18197.1 Trk-type K+ transport system, membrane component [Marinactinospora thermotolerans DSM 45154]
MLGSLRGARSRIVRLLHRERAFPGFAHSPGKGNLWRRPARLFVLAFATVDLLGTVLLLLPAAHADGEGARFTEAFFTSTSALCVAGLAIVDTGGHWSVFGELVILGLIQVGGLGIMTLASLLGIVVIRRFGLRMQLSVQTETRSLNVGEVRGIAGRVLKLALVCEVLVALVLVPRMWLSYDMTLPEAIYSGVFHAVSAFNNAGLSLYGDSLTRFVSDPIILVPIALATMFGGLGFPVLLELRRRFTAPRQWTLHTKMTVYTSGALFAIGMVVVTALEWSNPATLGTMDTLHRLLAGAFHGVMPRSGGLNVVDVGAMEDSTLFVTIMLMFVGGGSAGTSGGIKVTTFAVILLVVWAEVRGHPHVHAFGRRLSSSAIRQALSLTFLSMTVVATATVYLLITTDFAMEQILFEVVSASAVVGLSTGITPDLPEHAQLMLAMLMFAGRVGPITFASALALRERTRRYDLAEARPIIG